MNEYQTYENQTLQDVASHVYGRVDVAFDLGLLNNLSVTDSLPAGTIIKLVEAPENIFVKTALEGRNIIPAVDFNAEDFEDMGFGIGSMIIETNFIVR